MFLLYFTSYTVVFPLFFLSFWKNFNQHSRAWCVCECVKCAYLASFWAYFNMLQRIVIIANICQCTTEKKTWCDTFSFVSFACKTSSKKKKDASQTCNFETLSKVSYEMHTMLYVAVQHWCWYTWWIGCNNFFSFKKEDKKTFISVHRCISRCDTFNTKWYTFILFMRHNIFV